MLAKIIQLDTHPTKNKKTGEINGWLIPIYKDYESELEPPKFIYMTACEPLELKGPHLHNKRDGNFVCLKGEVVFIIKEKDGYKEYFLSENKNKLLHIPAGVPCAHINLSLDKECVILNFCSKAWHPDEPDDEPVVFDDYNWRRWVGWVDEEFRLYHPRAWKISMPKWFYWLFEPDFYRDWQRKLDNVKKWCK